MNKNIKLNSYKDLIVWQRGVELVKEIYMQTKKLPHTEIYALSSQMQRSAVSIPANIAEGYCRYHRAEFLQFLSIANGSAGELETHIIIAKDVYPHIKWANSESLIIEIKKMLYALISKMSSKHYTLCAKR